MSYCECVSTHYPVCRSVHDHHIHPLGMGGPDTYLNIVRLCPNQHAMTHRLLRLWGYRYDGEPPWWIRRHFSPIARDLAEQGWNAWDGGGRPVARRMWLYQGGVMALDPEAALRFLAQLKWREANLYGHHQSV